MNERALELLPDYVLGVLSEEEAREIDALVAQSPELQAEVDTILQSYDALALSLEPLQPSADAKLKLFDALDNTAERFMPWAANMAKYFDLTVKKVQELLHKIDDPAAWEKFPLPGISAVHFSGGPNAFAPDCGWARIEKGHAFPYHRHAVDEINFVLQGQLIDSSGTVYGPGSLIINKAGTEHKWRSGDEEDLLLGVIQDDPVFLPDPEGS